MAEPISISVPAGTHVQVHSPATACAPGMPPWWPLLDFFLLPAVILEYSAAPALDRFEQTSAAFMGAAGAFAFFWWRLSCLASSLGGRRVILFNRSQTLEQISTYHLPSPRYQNPSPGYKFQDMYIAAWYLMLTLFFHRRSSKQRDE